MDNCIYRKKEFIILTVGHEYIAINQNKVFKKGHTHLKSFKQAEYLINIALHRRIPRHLSSYMLTSLIRISNDESYIESLQELIATKSERKQKYVNR